MLKNVSYFRKYLIFLFVLLACTLFFSSCGMFGSDTPSQASNTQNAAITPVGAATVCLTVHSPSLVKLGDGHFKLVDEIDNCSEKNVSSFQITAQIATDTTKQSASLTGPTTISAKGKATYNTFVGQAGDTGTNKELQFSAPQPSSAIVTVLVTLNGSVQGEWDGQVTIPAS